MPGPIGESEQIRIINRFRNKFLTYCRKHDHHKDDQRELKLHETELVYSMTEMLRLSSRRFLDILLKTEIPIYYNDMLRFGKRSFILRVSQFYIQLTALNGDAFDPKMKKFVDISMDNGLFTWCVDTLRGNTYDLAIEVMVINLMRNLQNVSVEKFAECDKEHALMDWLLKKLSEVCLFRQIQLGLLIFYLIHPNLKNRVGFAKMGGLLIFSKRITHYVLMEPNDIQEREYVALLYAVLEIVLQHDESRIIFAKSNIIEKFAIIMESGAYAGYYSLKAFNTALRGKEGMEVYKVLVPNLNSVIKFMSEPFNEDLMEGTDFTLEEFEYYTTSILYNMLRISRRLNSARIINIFKNNMTPLLHILLLHSKYLKAVNGPRNEELKIQAWGTLQYVDGILLQLTVDPVLKDRVLNHLAWNKWQSHFLTDGVLFMLSTYAALKYEDHKWVGQEQMSLLELADSF